MSRCSFGRKAWPSITFAICPGHKGNDTGPGTLSLRPTSRSMSVEATPGRGWWLSFAGFLSTTYQLAGAVAKTCTAWPSSTS
jgi:hypothetical protein